jgi:hypothetical protein
MNPQFLIREMAVVVWQSEEGRYLTAHVGGPIYSSRFPDYELVIYISR